MLKKFIQARKATANEMTDTPKINLKSPSALAAPPILLPAKAVPKEEGNKLVVGPNIELKGSEITDCEILIVEGRVEAAMKSRHIRIAQGGVFVGTAEVDVAEIRGCFDGDLIVHKRLVIYATAQIHGHIRYATMQVEEGAVITGSIDMLSLETQSQVDVIPSDMGQLSNFNLFQPTVVHKRQH